MRLCEGDGEKEELSVRELCVPLHPPQHIEGAESRVNASLLVFEPGNTPEEEDGNDKRLPESLFFYVCVLLNKKGHF